MKSFREFNIIIEGRSREEAEKARQSKPNPGNWTLENAGSSINPSWRVKKKSGGSEGSSGGGGGRATASASKASEKAIQQRQVASAAQGRKKTAPQPVTKKPEAKPAPKKPAVKKPYGPGNPHPDKGKIGIGGPVDEYGRTGHDRANNPDHPLNKKKKTATPAPKKPVAKKPEDNRIYKANTASTAGKRRSQDFYRRFDKK